MARALPYVRSGWIISAMEPRYSCSVFRWPHAAVSERVSEPKIAAESKAFDRASDRPTAERAPARERWTESGRVSSEQLALKRWTSETNVESKLAIIVHSFLRSFAHSRGSTSYSVGFHPTALALTIPSSSVAERRLGEARD